jgi:hypothetical protein
MTHPPDDAGQFGSNEGVSGGDASPPSDGSYGVTLDSRERFDLREVVVDRSPRFATGAIDDRNVHRKIST